MQFPNTIEEIMENPKKYGAPTLEEFIRDREKNKVTVDSKLGMIDQSTKILKNKLIKQTYFFRGIFCDKLEEVEYIAINEGIDLKQCTISPQIVPQLGGKFSILVTITPPIIQKYSGTL
jgi:hypothetical protein